MSCRFTCVIAIAALVAQAPAATGADRAERHANTGVELDAVVRGRPVEERVGEIRRRVQAAATYPALAQLRRLEGTSVVAFEIDAQGRPHEVALASSSGFPLLDRAAARAVEDAGRLPWVYGRLEIPVRFELMARR